MRMMSRVESLSFPYLDSLEESWALEVEREGDTSSLHGEDELLHRDTERMKQRESSCWNSPYPKRLNSDSREAYHRRCERGNVSSSNRAIRSYNTENCRNRKGDTHRYGDSCSGLRHLEETSRAWQFTSSSRCYPSSIQIRSSELTVAEKKRAFQHHGQTQRDLHEAWSYGKLDKSFCSFAKTEKANHNSKIERKTGYGASERRRDCADDLPHVQDGQKFDGGKLEDWSSFCKNSQSGYSRPSRTSSEHRSQRTFVKKLGYQGHCNGVTDCKVKEKTSQSMSAFLSEMKQYNGGVVAEQSFEVIQSTYNEVASAALSQADVTTENASAEGTSMLKSDCNNKLEVEMDDLAGPKQYEMLASLLMDDSLDIDKDFDLTVASGVQDSECCGSIFCNDLELPVSMDVDNVAEAPAAKAGEAENLNDKNVRKAVKKVSASQPAGKPHNVCAASGPKLSPTVFIDVTNKFEIHTVSGEKREVQEDDAHRLSQRQRQIEFGKNTLGYERYNELIPRYKRKAKDPQTPNPKQICSKRSWDGQIRKWRRLLHVYDPPSEDGEEIAEDFSVIKLHPGLGEKFSDARDTSLDHRLSESYDNKKCNAVDKKIVKDTSLTIYDDWMES